nr:PREDICTED: uncharacterized protein LOC102365127 [Latimeria chalumnae]|eukprot:XP_014341951.1 PREDICTED: uncharacterized protein LOC102365127 [Latimeria chalumnae]
MSWGNISVTVVSTKHKVDLFFKLRHVMNELIDLRRQLLSGHLTQDQIRDVKRHITVRLDWGNEQLGLDLVPRKDFELVDSEQISVSDLYKMHLSSRHSVQQSTSQVDTMRQRHGEACRIPVPHHLFLTLKSFTYNTIGEDNDIFFSLYDVREGKQIRYVQYMFVVVGMPYHNAGLQEKVDGVGSIHQDIDYDYKDSFHIDAQASLTPGQRRSKIGVVTRPKPVPAFILVFDVKVLSQMDSKLSKINVHKNNVEERMDNFGKQHDIPSLQIKECEQREGQNQSLAKLLFPPKLTKGSFTIFSGDNEAH